MGSWGDLTGRFGPGMKKRPDGRAAGAIASIDFVGLRFVPLFVKV
jgi:hypothetical protein